MSSDAPPGDTRLNMPATPENARASRVAAERLRSRNAGCLLLFCVLGGACSSVESVPLGGNGGQGGNTSCLNGPERCVSTCGADPAWPQPYCDAAGAFQCPAGSVRLSSCPPGACVLVFDSCCDEATGHVARPGCSPDGLSEACPTGTHAARASCVPTTLPAVSDCYQLKGTPCDSLGQECHTTAQCTCVAGDGGMVWDCKIDII